MSFNNINKKTTDIYKIPTIVLALIAVYDLIRGIMHCYAMTATSIYFAHFDISTAPREQLMLMGSFGISNFLTSSIYILICCKARQLTPYILFLIPVAYLIGSIGILSNGVHANEGTFIGRYFMFVYLAICVLTVLIFWYQKFKKSA